MDEVQSKGQEIEQIRVELDQAKEELTTAKDTTDMHNAQQQSVSEKLNITSCHKIFNDFKLLLRS